MLETEVVLLEPAPLRAPAAAGPAPSENADRDPLNGHPPPPSLIIALVNVPYRSETNGFDGEVLDAFCRTREVEAAREYFYVVDGRPHLSCWIEWRARSTAVEPPSRAARPDTGRRGRARAAREREFETPMGPHEQRTFDALRVWRLECARGLGVPPYRVLTNRAMERVSRAQPLERSQLGAIEGVGPATLDAYGAQILSVIASERDASGAADGLQRESNTPKWSEPVELQSPPPSPPPPPSPWPMGARGG